MDFGLIQQTADIFEFSISVRSRGLAILRLGRSRAKNE
jgi:hypothetical protein